jgi:hypothetical protein
MADMNDLKERLKQIAEAVRNKLPDIAVTLTISAKALAEREIRNQGFGSVYSKNKIPAWFLDGKELNGAGAAWLDAKKKKDAKNTHVQDGQKFYPADYGTNWGEFRAAQGLQTAHVDLGYTNMMWSNMQPVRVEQKGDVYLAPLGGTNTETQDKMNWNRDRYGDFIGKVLTDEHRLLLIDVVVAEVVNVLDQFQP